MSDTFGRLEHRLISSAIVGSLALVLGIGYAAAQNQPSSTTIINKLTPKPTTRGLTPADAAKNAADEKFIDSLRSRTTRSLSVGEREKIADVTKDKPSIDLEINFEFNSAQIGARATPQVNELGKALTDPNLKGNTFILAGYADAKGNDSYNQQLSERRAESVKQYLVEKFGISASNLVTAGYGKTHLKNTSDPYAAENRRVAVSNMADSKVSNK
jgi:outer membrane protein OmpA-like peptidoglycan-associated protein